MKKLLTLTAVAEAGTGVALMVVPSLVGRLLFGAEFFGVAAVVGRFAGIALFALGIASWLARTDTQSRAARGLVAAMLFYNVAVAALLSFAGLGLGLRGVMLWPAVILHAVMAVWCAACLRRSPQNVID
jgi:hypothetical protein